MRRRRACFDFQMTPSFRHPLQMFATMPARAHVRQPILSLLLILMQETARCYYFRFTLLFTPPSTLYSSGSSISR